MITYFEDETKPLDVYERELLPIMVKSLQRHVGRRQAVTNRAMQSGLAESGYEISDARIRKLISHIRINGLVECLMATSKGYYVTTDVKELEDYVESLRGRVRAIDAVVNAMQDQLEHLKLRKTEGK